MKPDRAAHVSTHSRSVRGSKAPVGGECGRNLLPAPISVDVKPPQSRSITEDRWNFGSTSNCPDIYGQQQRPPNVGGAKRVEFDVFSSRPPYRRLSGCIHTPGRSCEVAPAGLSPLVTAIMGRAKYDVLFRNTN